MRAMSERNVPAILRALKKAHPDARLWLDFDGPWQLLVATILAAQCRDETINEITPVLFGRWPDPAALAGAPDAELQKVVKASGFFRNKAKSIKAASRALVEEFGGEVPGKLDDLLTLPGVGRKTANIVLAHAFGKQAIGVDTHVGRVSVRIGFSGESDPDKIEADLCGQVPRRRWREAMCLLGTHGRRICLARKPRCGECPISAHCDEYARAKKESPGMFD
jgi:endonuclease-3